jgi:hypothetical protein
MSRHNRRRTRSRHRNRKSSSNEFQGFHSASAETPPSISGPVNLFPPRQPSAELWNARYSAWQDKARRQRQIDELQASRTQHAEATRIRIFGGEMGDGVALCHPMLQVVRSLFDGDLDYADP